MDIIRATPFLRGPLPDVQIPDSLNPTNWSGGRCTANLNGVEVATIQGFECIFRNIVRILIPVIGLALFVMLIVGSFQYLTSGGEAKSIEKARKTLTSALFGLLAFFGIWFILKLITTITGVDLSTFIIPGP